MITVSAPGKLMLFGEHAVVYHRPCIVAAVDSRVSVSLVKNHAKKVELTLPEVEIFNYQRPINQIMDLADLPKGVRFVETAINLLYQRYQLKTGITLKTKNGFSCKYGLGSSSAVSVCTIKGMSEAFNLNLTKKEIFDLAYEVVLQVQGVGSGFDVAAAVWGGMLYFVTGGEMILPFKEVTALPLIIGFTSINATS